MMWLITLLTICQKNKWKMPSQDNLTDRQTTIHTLREIIAEFVSSRDWDTYHSPKNLVMALSVEVAELMEHLQWLTLDESREIPTDPEKFQLVKEEICDCLAYTLALVNSLDFDLSASVQEKMVKNRLKYPIDSKKTKNAQITPSESE